MCCRLPFLHDTVRHSILHCRLLPVLFAGPEALYLPPGDNFTANFSISDHLLQMDSVPQPPQGSPSCPPSSALHTIPQIMPTAGGFLARTASSMSFRETFTCPASPSVFVPILQIGEQFLQEAFQIRLQISMLSSAGIAWKCPRGTTVDDEKAVHALGCYHCHLGGFARSPHDDTAEVLRRFFSLWTSLPSAMGDIHSLLPASDGPQAQWDCHCKLCPTPSHVQVPILSIQIISALYLHFAARSVGHAAALWDADQRCHDKRQNYIIDQHCTQLAVGGCPAVRRKEEVVRICMAGGAGCFPRTLGYAARPAGRPAFRNSNMDIS
jgi:hypothetical protein